MLDNAKENQICALNSSRDLLISKRSFPEVNIAINLTKKKNKTKENQLYNHREFLLSEILIKNH